MNDPADRRTPGRGWTRRRVLGAGAGAAGVAALAVAGGLELVVHGVLPGHAELDRLDGGCDVSEPSLAYSVAGPAMSATFYSAARHRTVGYGIAWPPGHGRGDSLPLIVALHGYGGDHAHTLVGQSPQRALAVHVDGRPLPAMAMVTVDGGDLYWHAHPGDDPMAMLVDEVLPRCAALGLGGSGQPVAVMGISMGGYGALLLAEKHPGLVTAVAAISPAVWTSWPQAHAADAGAFTSPADFAANDVVTHTAPLRPIPVRVASGDDDPFRPGVEALVRRLPLRTVVDFSGGCHTDPFFFSQQAPSLAFLGRHLTA